MRRCKVHLYDYDHMWNFIWRDKYLVLEDPRRESHDTNSEVGQELVLAIGITL